jgi:anti-sigma factor RsiW
MMTCRELAETLLDFVSGELPPDGRGHVEDHLGRCPSCRAYHDSYFLTVRLARRLPDRPLPPRLAERLRVLLAGATGTVPPPPKGERPRPAAGP